MSPELVDLLRPSISNLLGSGHRDYSRASWRGSGAVGAARRRSAYCIDDNLGGRVHYLDERCFTAGAPLLAPATIEPSSRPAQLPTTPRRPATQRPTDPLANMLSGRIVARMPKSLTSIAVVIIAVWMILTASTTVSTTLTIILGIVAGVL